MKKYLLLIITIFLFSFNIKVSASSEATELYSLDFTKDILKNNGNGINVGNSAWNACTDNVCKKEIIDNYITSNNDRMSFLWYVMDGEQNKQECYIYWSNKFCSKVANTSNTRCLNDNEYLTITITKDKNGNPLNINTGNYQDIRFSFNNLIKNIFTDHFKNNQFVLYYYDTENNKYGPYYIDDYVFNGYKARDVSEGTVDYAVEYKIISQNLKPSTNVIINKIELLPQGNSPVSKAENFSNDWRNNEDASFYLASMSLYGYRNGTYKREEVEMKSIDVDDARINAAKSMYDLVTVRWKPSHDMTNMTTSGNNNGSYKANHYYYGPFYSNYSNASLENFKNYLNGDELEYKTDNNNQQYKYLPGAACSSSVSYSMSKHINGIDRFQTVDYIFGRNNTYLLGNLEIDGKKGINESVYSDLYTDYINKINSNNINVDKKNLYGNTINKRIKSNDLRVFYKYTIGDDGNFYHWLGYTNKKTDSSSNAIAEEEKGLKIKVDNLSISTGKQVEISFNYLRYDANVTNDGSQYPDPEVRTNYSNTEYNIKMNVCYSNETCTDISNINISSPTEIYTNNDGKQVNMFKVTGTITSTNNIVSIQIMPHGNRFTGLMFRLHDLEIKVSNNRYYYMSVSQMATYFNFTYGDLIQETLINKINTSIPQVDMNKLFADFLARQDIYKGYSELMAGDNVSTHSEANTHARMITGSTHVVCLDGTTLANITPSGKKIPRLQGNCNNTLGIDSYASYNIVTDISASPISTSYVNRNNYGGLINDNDFVAMQYWTPNDEYTDLVVRSDGKQFENIAGKNIYNGTETYNNFNYEVNYKIIFADEWKNRKNEYLPVSLNAYKNGTVEKLYTKYINGNTSDNIKNGFKGSIYSNYPIISINYHIENKSTNDVYEKKIYNEHSDIIGFMGSYSLYYHTPDEVKNKLTELISNTDSYNVVVTIDAGTETNLPVLSIKSYTITADADGGVIPSTTGWTLGSNGATASKPIVYDETYGLLPIPTKSGYTFQGWFTAKTGGKEVTSDTVVHATQSYTMYARWIKNSDVFVDSDNYTYNSEKRFIILNEEKLGVTKYKSDVTLTSSYSIQINIGTSSYVYTGSKAKIIKDNNEVLELTNVILGDPNGDGKISSADYIAIRKHLMESALITDEAKLMAANYNKDSKVSSADYVQIRKYLMSS